MILVKVSFCFIFTWSSRFLYLQGPALQCGTDLGRRMWLQLCLWWWCSGTLQVYWQVSNHCYMDAKICCNLWKLKLHQYSSQTMETPCLTICLLIYLYVQFFFTELENIEIWVYVAIDKRMGYGQNQGQMEMSCPCGVLPGCDFVIELCRVSEVLIWYKDMFDMNRRCDMTQTKVIWTRWRTWD